MTLQLKFIWLLFNLCAIVGGSTGFSIFPSKEPFSAAAPVEEQKLGYTPSASPFLNGPAIQPPLTSHPFESSPPGPENIQPLPPQVPSTANVSPTQSVAAAPHDKSPGPDASIKVSPSKEPPSSATPPPGVPLHDLTLQQPAPSPVFLAPLHPVPEAPLHDLAPQSSARVYAPPPVVALPDVPDLSHKQPVAAPYAPASPQASISTHASRPASTAVPSRFSSLPPSAISPHTSVPSPPVMPSHVFASPPPISPPTSGAMPPFATSHDSATAPPAISPSILSSSPPVLPLHSSAAPPPLRSQYASAPSVVAMPSHTVGQRPSASSPHAFSSSPHASSTPTHTIKPHKLASSPPFVPPEGRPSADLAPPPSTTNLPRDSAPSSTAQPELPHDLSTPSTPMTSRSSAPLSPVGSVVLSPHSPPIRKHALPIPVVLPSHLASPLPAVAPHGPSPFLDAGPPHAFHNVTPPVPSGSSAPPPVDVPSRDFGSSPVSPYAFATPKPRVPSHSSTPPPQAMPSPVTGPPRPSTIPPIAIPLPALFPPPPEKPVSAPPPTYTPHVSAPPPSSTITEHPPPQSPPAPMHASYPPPDGLSPIVSLPPPKAAPSHAVAPSPPATSPAKSPYVSAPPPNATISEHSSAPPPPTPPIHVSNSPPQVTPPIVSPSPPEAAPSHGLAPFPPAETRFSAPPPSSTRHFSTPPTSSPAAKNASYPPSASVTPHTSAPSTSAEPPLAASPPSAHTVTPGSLPPVAYQRKKPKSQLSPVSSNSSAPLVAPPVRSPSIIPVVPREPPSIPPEAQLPHVSSPAPSIHQRGDQVPVMVAPSGPTFPLSPTSHQPKQGFSPYIAPTAHKSRWVPVVAPVATISPPISPLPEAAHGPSISPLPSTSEAHPRNGSQSAPETSYIVPSPAPKQHGQDESPDSSVAPAPESAQRYHSPFSHQPGSSAAMAPSPSPLTEDYISPVSMPAIPVQSPPSMTPFLPPTISPSPSSTKKPKLSPPILALPPPPPNRDCLSITCLEPYTNTIAGSPCGCILPMKVELRIGVALYTFFPLVPELAREVATGIFMKQSQVRIMGANAASEQPDKTLLLIDLVPLGDKFDNITAFLIFERFWNKQVAISESLFGDYEVLYVQYPGLPPSPPMAPSDIAAINGGPYPGDNGSKIHPLGVDITKQGRKHRLSGSLIAIIVFSAVGAGLLCLLLGWIFLFRHRREVTQSAEAPHVYPSSIARSTGPTGQSAGSRPSFSLSFESSVAAYTGSAKTFSAGEIEKATDNFDSSRVLGEGGFGRVYSGVLEDGTEVAVKVLKREDQQGGREFLAEIEMLSRLHHRNLVKLIGMCVEEHSRCLVYELIPNGSVESHLHGVGGQTSPLDWATRMKIALGAARGLAYLHEDSSPRVIHRDFKASNILLEADFTPKVSDFGLARTAMDEENRHVSTRVMGTFGYVAPEYAMTGHLLVKSDVYSYGVVLLELLTGRKPVDMSQPPGQENLVAWTRPYLTSKEALKSIVDASLGPDISFDSVAKVAAIASMCVQPEVSHRPFMGEVVQALKLVCNECDGSKDEGDESPTSCSPENSLNEAREPMQSRSSEHSHGSGGNGKDVEKGLSKSDIFSARDTGLGCEESDSFRRHSSSGPIGSGRSWRFWKRGRTTSSREGVGEHGMYRFWSGSH